MPTRRMPPAIRRSSFATRRCSAHGETLRDRLARAAPPGRRRSPRRSTRMGVQPGDRVGAFLPNLPQTAVAFLACASLGAIWSVCSPDMGPLAVLDRFRQIEPKVLIACDGYVYGGVAHDRLPVLRELLDDAAERAPRGAAAPPRRRGRRRRSLAGPSRAAHDFDALVADDAAVRAARGCRSTIRSGSSTRAAPPACRSRSCTATAA